MRKRGAGLNSSEANFVFGGEYQEQVYRSPDGPLTPYDQSTAATDHVLSPNQPPVQSSDIIIKRDAEVAKINSNIHDAAAIEASRRMVAHELNRLQKPDVDQQR